MTERLEWLNYHHLLYFWVVAREGGLQPAGRVLGLTHSTLSAQIHALEDRLGEKLLAKSGRKLALTETGRVVFRYAEEIFGLGRELLGVVQGKVGSRMQRLAVGVVDVVPKIVVRRLLQPALDLDAPVQLACYEDSLEKLLADLSMHTLDIVISDAPLPPGSSVRAFNHLLGETGITFFSTNALHARYASHFPQGLDGAPMLLPLENSALRRSLNQWFDRHGIVPHVVAEFEDSALLKVFGGDGVGVFPSPTVVEREILEQYGVRVLGRADVRERFYAISVERRLTHPAVLAISGAARDELFASRGKSASS